MPYAPKPYAKTLALIELIMYVKIVRLKSRHRFQTKYNKCLKSSINSNVCLIDVYKAIKILQNRMKVTSIIIN